MFIHGRNMLFVSNKIRLAILHANDRENIYSYKWMPMEWDFCMAKNTFWERYSNSASTMENGIYFSSILCLLVRICTHDRIGYEMRTSHCVYIRIFIRYIVFRCIMFVFSISTLHPFPSPFPYCMQSKRQQIYPHTWGCTLLTYTVVCYPGTSVAVMSTFMFRVNSSCIFYVLSFFAHLVCIFLNVCV